MNRSHKRHPQTHLPDPNMVMLFTFPSTKTDSKFNRSSGSMHVSYNHNYVQYLTSASFHVGNPEGIHQLMILFSDRGTPESVRHMNAYSGHTYKFTKAVSQNSYSESCLHQHYSRMVHSTMPKSTWKRDKGFEILPAKKPSEFPARIPTIWFRICSKLLKGEIIPCGTSLFN